MLAMAIATSLAAAGEAAVLKDGGERFDLRQAIQCTSEDGSVFATRNGGMCHKGDLAYINVAFDSNEAGDLADRYCDFTKERPAEAMDVYGVLCYLRVNAPVHPTTGK